MTRNMSKMNYIMTRLFTLLLLMVFSMGAQADVKVLYGEKGTDKFEGTGGTIEVKQEESKDDATKVTVTLIVTPADGYTMERDNGLEVYAVVSPTGASTRAPEILGDALKLDCTDFTDISEMRTYITSIDSKLALWVKKVNFMKRDNGGSKGITVTPTTGTDGNGTIEDSEKNLYLIQTNQFESFYITPNGTNLNTANLPHASMLWYFLEAENDNGTQYYYIVNNSNGKYISNSDYSTKGRTIKLETFDANNTDKFKFKFVENNPSGATGYYNIDIKPNGGSYPALNKQSGNVSTNGIRLTESKYTNNTNSRWKFIPYNGTLTWPNPPFTVSTDLEKHYFKIRNRKTNTFYVSVNQNTSKVTYSTNDNNDVAWYFKEAPSDNGLMKYYYVINPAAGNKYMYYDGNTDTSDKTDAVSIKDINDANAEADRFLFVVVQAAATVGNTDTPDNGYYMIVPKKLIGNLWSSNSLGTNSASNGSNMGIISGRVDGANAYPHWSFETTIYPKVCAAPDVHYSSEVGEENKIEITCATEGATIYYTTNGDDPKGEGITPLTYNPADKITVTDGMTVVKAYAAVSGSSLLPSDVTTFNIAVAYTYNIVNTQGNIAIKLTVNQREGVALSNTYTSIPAAIRSPYLEGETVTFYTFSGDYDVENLTDGNKITCTPAGGGNIYVKYTTDHLGDDDKPMHLHGTRPFKIQINNEYIYDNSASWGHSASDGGSATQYLWKVEGDDPYRVQIQSMKYTNHYFKWSTSPSPSLTLDDTSYFIILDGSSAAPEGFTDQVELMAATGADVSSATYYNVGRPDDSNVGLLASSTYPQGYAAIQVLFKAEQRNVTFHIIDMSGHIVVEQSGAFDELAVPEQWRSPLVANYHYYTFGDFRVIDNVYTLKIGHEDNEIASFLDAPSDIYVTYEPSDTYDLDGSENRATDGKRYLLKFAGGTSFRQENDNGFDTNADEGTDSYYPYINGEGGLFVYGQAKLDATEGAVGSTRTRWAWYLEGGDPYRLRISSLQTKTDGVDESHHSYLRTYKPQGYDQVVTGVISDNSKVTDGTDGTDPTGSHDARHKPTDYMILNGTNGHFKLVTSDVVDDYNDETVDERHTVTSFENYWKTNPTAINVVKAYYNNESIYKDGEPTEEQKTAALVTGQGWHSYDVWANGSTWTNSKKVFGYGEHWFQTIGVGTETETLGVFNGDFDLEEYDLDGALILLDQHGWEVMRKPITNLSTKKEAYASELRKYDSPMVKKYHFWTNFKKEDGYHKYKPIRGESDDKKNAQYQVSGTSLADYREVLSNGTLADIYVTYDVMATYRDGYTGAATEGGINYSNSKYLIKQGGNYAKTEDGATITSVADVDLTDPSSIGNELLWYVKPNFNIDAEMGYIYSGSNSEKTQAETESAYFANRDATVHDTTNGQNGFDPYNLQIESVNNPGKLFTTNATDAERDGSGGMQSTYGDTKTVTLQEYGQAFVASDYYDMDKKTHIGYQMLHVTNSTFMAVGDANGNIRLMPRFDHHSVETSLTTLADQLPAASYGDESGTQTTLFILPSSSSSSAGGLVYSSDEITNMSGSYTLAPGFNVTKVIGTAAKPFTGTIDGQLNVIDGLARPLVAYADGATIKNVIVKTASINAGNADRNAGAICCQATGATRIYNCGILPTYTERDEEGNVTGFTGSHVSGSENVGGIVGLLGGNARVINCFSYATITGGTTKAGIVGNIGYAADASIDQDHVGDMPMVVNCMFYGDITGGGSPVYGGASGAMIKNDADKGVNPYCYFRKGASFDDSYGNIDAYKRSWPAEEKNLTRFEYYRSVLNSNRRLCTWWVNGTSNTAPTDADVTSVDIAKWVLDPSIAPFPILKKWGKYPSVINIDVNNPDFRDTGGPKRFDPVSETWVSRSTANEWEGKSYGTLEVTISAGSNNSSAPDVTKNITITDMDTLNCDYGYYKIQLPYYNEVFGNPNGETHAAKYGNNYTAQVVTGWEITSTDGSDAEGHSFSADWENGYNFADRQCVSKDLYATSGRVFAQGGYYYVPEGVTSISIKAHWGKAVYLANRGYSIDRVNVTNSGYKKDKAFSVVGTIKGTKDGIAYDESADIKYTFQGQNVYDDLQSAIKALTSYASADANSAVFDQAIVLIGNHQVKNGSNSIGYNVNSDWRPFTIMSADFDFDNEPDYCLQLQFRHDIDRPGIQPVRFDFLPVIELGLAVRHDKKAYAIGIFVPHGHFEITETAFMRTTQFEYDGPNNENYRVSGKSPMIINGGEFESFNFRYHSSDRTSYFLLGGKAWIHRFAPGLHPNASNNARAYLCAVNAIGGEYPEFYLSGLYKAGTAAPNNQGAPHCYTNGGKFGTVAGTGYDKVAGGVTFKINHSLIKEFYGGGINGSNPLGGNIDVTIDYSRVNKYCGGPKVGDMTGKTVTTHATGTTFGIFYGGGNGGNSYYRQMQDDGDWDSPADGTIGETFWNNRKYNWKNFTPLSTYYDDGSEAGQANGTKIDNKGYHAEYEFEVFNQSNGVADKITQRGFIRWIQFGETKTGNVTSTLTDCTINTNFFGGGNLATVVGTVTSTLTNTKVLGNVYGAGYSAAIPTFTVHDKDRKTFPSMDFAGTITDGDIPNMQEGGKDIEYEWTNDLNGKTKDERKADPAYPKTVIVDGEEVTKWYCYTWSQLVNLGAVLNNVTLTLDGNTVVGTVGNPETGNVYGGGDASAVGHVDDPNDNEDEDIIANTTVNLQGNTRVLGNVFGGGNEGLVNGSATVNIRPVTP